MEATLLVDHQPLTRSCGNSVVVVRTLLTISGSAQSLIVHLTVSPGVGIFAIHDTWPIVEQNERAVKFDLGNLHACETKQLLLELVIDSVKHHAFDSDTSTVATFALSASELLSVGNIEPRATRISVFAPPAGQRTIQPDIEQAMQHARTARACEEAARRQRATDTIGTSDVVRGKTRYEETLGE